MSQLIQPQIGTGVNLKEQERTRLELINVNTNMTRNRFCSFSVHKGNCVVLYCIYPFL